MSEQNQSSDVEAYDPAEDPDSDPEMLQPRTGDEAAGAEQTAGDPDADPDMLNPRADDADQG